MFEVSYIEENKIEMEAQLFAVQLFFNIYSLKDVYKKHERIF